MNMRACAAKILVCAVHTGGCKCAARQPSGYTAHNTYKDGEDAPDVAQEDGDV